MEDYWLIIGFAGQIFFTMRFAVQWLESERRRRSVIPAAFWYFSLLGGVVLLIYAIHRRDPVFIAGQSFGTVIYLRNIYFLCRERRSDAGTGAAVTPGESRRGPLLPLGKEENEIMGGGQGGFGNRACRDAVPAAQARVG